MTQPRLSLIDVCKSFDSKKILQNLTLDIRDGESLVVIGGSGSGKSVMLKCILGLLSVDSGCIQLDGRDLTKGSKSNWEESRSKISMLFQGSALFDSLTVWENVAFRLLQQKVISRQEARQQALDKIAMVGLPREAGLLFPSALSGGMQRRVALARAVITKPEILFFDEPTTGLDPIMANIINQLIRTQVKDLGATALTITHDMNSVREIADRVAMLYQGKIVWPGPVTDIDHTEDPLVDQFVQGRTEGPISVEVK